MNTYDFVLKGYGLGDLVDLNLFIQIYGEPKEYQVERVKSSDLNIIEHLPTGGATRFLGKNSNLQVQEVILCGPRKIVGNPKVLLMIRSPT